MFGKHNFGKLFNFDNFFNYEDYNQKLEDSIKDQLSIAKKIINVYTDKTGAKVTEEIYKGNGFEFTSTSYEYEPDENYTKLQNLILQKQKAIKEDRYEDAAKLRDEIELIKETLKKEKGN